MTRPVTVGEVVDRIPVGRYQHRLLAVTGLIWAATPLSILVISFTIPVFRDIWSLSPVAAGVLGSATLFGMIFGSSLGGWYADRRGRRRTLAGSVACFSLCTGATALATGLYSALVLRFLTGLGVGAAIAADASYLTEHVPADRRGRYLAYLEVFFPLGTVAIVAAAAVVVPTGVAGGTVAGVAAWRVLYLIAAAPIVLVALVYTQVRESPYYLAQTGDHEGAIERLDAMAAENGASVEVTASALAATGDGVTSGATTGFQRLVAPAVLPTTLLLSALWFGLNFAYYGVFIWLPDTIAAAGYLGGLYTYLLVVTGFQLGGALAAATLVERIGRRRLLGGSFTLAGLSTAVFALALPGVDAGVGIDGTAAVLAGLFGTGFFLFAVFATLFGYTTESFPTAVRSTGMGVASGVGKVAAVLGPVLAGWLVPAGYLVTLAPFALALVAAGVLVTVAGTETAGSTLR